MANHSGAPAVRTRRHFLKLAAQLSAGGGLAALIGSVNRASAIQAEPGTTYADAEHVVILMQENRSFDHLFGTLRGVRGFNDPRGVTLPDGNPVWLQTNASGETYAPYRLDIKGTNATWLGSLPHSWRDQTDARNHGNHDRWLESKRSSRRECAGMPLTMGHYNRDDLPFYYALADAFTICDQYFCSSLTGTTPNRLYLWTGTIRDQQTTASPAHVRNSDVDFESSARWTTFPERLEDAGISWKIYQNEISLPSGLSGDEDAWLSNFSDNPIEWFEQYQVHFSKTFRHYAESAAVSLPREIAALDAKISTANDIEAVGLRREKRSKERQLRLVADAPKFTDAAWERLRQRDRNLHEKAFSTNSADPAYRQLTTLRYRDGPVEREMTVPRGDVLHQFRTDVANGKLPAVTWLVPPENFSDHPSAPWYGAWMVSEVLNILTHNPSVWKKTIFVLTYDENDGYFDHVVPFGAPNPSQPETGNTSEGLDASIEYWSRERDLQKANKDDARGSSIGLGFRVPMIVASPWSRGGYVCSQVFDHTSVLQLLEGVCSRSSGKAIRETNISPWRRAVCGDLSSTFQAATEAGPTTLDFPKRDAVFESIHNARFKPLPAGQRRVTTEDAQQVKADRFSASWMPRQEPGVRPSLPLPYELDAGGKLGADGKSIEITLEARKRAFGARSAGAPFHVYAQGLFHRRTDLRAREYAVEAGKQVADTWTLDGFEGGAYHLCICGPNGFLRELRGSAEDPALDFRCEYPRNSSGVPDGDLAIEISHRGARADYTIDLKNYMYQGTDRKVTLRGGKKETIRLTLANSFSWYDFAIRVAGNEAFSRRYAGHVETGKRSFSDPVMGRI